MDDISKKSTASMIDELITTCMKCWFAQEDIVAGGDQATVAEAAIRAQNLNSRRNLLMRAIDDRLGEAGISLTEKTYTKP